MKPVDSFIRIPRNLTKLLRNKHVSHVELSVLLVMFEWHDKKDGCLASNSYLVEACNLSDRCIKNTIKTLINKDLITKTLTKSTKSQNNQVQNSYKINLTKIDELAVISLEDNLTLHSS
jgi:hypothetical protein